jgi:hypothetical protein
MESMDAQHDPLDTAAVLWLLRHLEGHSREEFDEGLAKRIDRLNVAEGADIAAARLDLLTWVRSWIVSTTLAGDDEWRAQMAESADRFARGDIGEPVGVEDLRGLLTR